MSSSVIPSEKYSCSGSFERFASGKTARDSIGRPASAEERLAGTRPRNPRKSAARPAKREAAARPSTSVRRDARRAGRTDAEAVEVAAVSDRAKARSRADWNRCSGFFSRQRRTIRSSPGATSGRSPAMSAGSSFRIALIVSTAEPPRKARRPESIS